MEALTNCPFFTFTIRLCFRGGDEQFGLPTEESGYLQYIHILRSERRFLLVWMSVVVG